MCTSKLRRKPTFQQLETRQLLAVNLVADLNATEIGSNPTYLGTIEGEAYFSASATSGRVTFKTDGVEVQEVAFPFPQSLERTFSTPLGTFYTEAQRVDGRYYHSIWLSDADGTATRGHFKTSSR